MEKPLTTDPTLAAPAYERLNLPDLYQKFADSKYGAVLNGRPRFELYRPRATSSQEWIETLGPDVDNLAHLGEVHNMGCQFLEASRAQTEQNRWVEYSEEDEYIILLTAIVHDFGEYKHGDINALLKTAQHDEQEWIALTEVLDNLVGKNILPLDQIHQAMFDHSSKLGRAFNNIERLGYLNTALVAFKTAESAENGPLQHGLLNLVASVLSNQLGVLIDYANDYEFTRDYLLNNQVHINKAIAEIQKYFSPADEAVDKLRTI